jgi:hypothetical protein
MGGNKAESDIIVTEDTQFSDLKLQWNAESGYSFEADVLENFCDNNDVDLVALLGNAGGFLTLMKAWYLACREGGGEIDPVAEKIIEADLAAANK